VKFLVSNYISGSEDPIPFLGVEAPWITQIDPLLVQGDTIHLAHGHFPFFAEHPHLGLINKVLYVMRNPKDVLFSTLNWYNLIEGKGKEETQLMRASFFIEHLGECWDFSGSWPRNVHSWLRQKELPMHVIRYENLLKDTAKELRNIVQFLALPVDEERIAHAVHCSSFAVLKELEQKYAKENWEEYSRGFPGVQSGTEKGDAELCFMHKGKSGHSLKELGTIMEKSFLSRFTPILEKFGYD
jgi:hypothetical protein